MSLFGPHKKILIISGLGVIGLCILHYLTYIDIKNKNENISILENNLFSQSNKQELTNSMESMVKNFDSDIKLVNNSIVSSDGDVLFIEDLESSAKSNGLDIQIDSLVFQDDKQLSSSTITFFNIKAKTTGGWLGTYLFLAQLELLPIKVKINSYSLNNISDSGENDIKKGGTQGNTWQSNFEINVLKFK